MFVNLQELYGVSVQLLASLDDCMEMAGQVKGWGQCPQAGFVFEEVAEVRQTQHAIHVLCYMLYMYMYIYKHVSM